jgi:hypothetical protein
MAMARTWRKHSQEIIAKVVAEVGTEDRAALKAALKAAYPYGQREYYPYKVWCEEVRKVVGNARHFDKDGAPKPTPVDVKNFWLKNRE